MPVDRVFRNNLTSPSAPPTLPKVPSKHTPILIAVPGRNVELPTEILVWLTTVIVDATARAGATGPASNATMETRPDTSPARDRRTDIYNPL